MILFKNGMLLKDYNLPLTTNNCESFHRHFNGIFTQSHPSFLKFIESLKMVQDFSELKIKEILLKIKKDTRNSRKNEVLKEIISKYDSFYVTNYCEVISDVYRWNIDLN